MWPLVFSLVKNAILPELLQWIESRHAETGKIPTLAEARTKLDTDVLPKIAEGQAFLETTAPPPAQ